MSASRHNYRKLFVVEAYQYRDHLLRLDPDSRQARFSAVVSNAAVRQHVKAIDWTTTEVLGYFRDGVMRGAVEVRFASAMLPASAELAFSVERPFQGFGAGTGLMARGMMVMRNRGVTCGHIVCLLTNRRMQKMALKYRANVKADCGEVFLTINAPHGDLSTLLAEFTDNCLGWLDIGFDIAKFYQPPLLAPFLGSGRAIIEPDGCRPG